MLTMEIIAVCSEINTKQQNLYGLNVLVEVLNGKSDGTYNNH